MDQSARPRFQTVVVGEEPVAAPPPPFSPQTPSTFGVPTAQVLEPPPVSAMPSPAVLPTGSSFGVPVTPPPPPAASTPSQPPMPTVSTTVSSKRHFKLSYIVFVFPAILVILTIVLVRFAVMSMQSTPEVVPQEPSPTLIPATPAPTFAPVVRTKSYTHTKPGYSFKYAETLSLVECSDSVKLLLVYDKEQQDDICDDQTAGDIIVKANGKEIEVPVNDGAVRETILVAGISAIKEVAGYTTYVYFSIEDNYYLIEAQGEEAQVKLADILSTFELVDENPTKGWLTYTGSGISFLYPPTWKVTATTNDITVSRDEEVTDTASARIQITTNVKDAYLTASQALTSTRTLTGWAIPPSVDLRTINGSSAQILSGQYLANWRIFGVLWYKNRVVEVLWNDNLEKPETKNFEYILANFKFAY